MVIRRSASLTSVSIILMFFSALFSTGWAAEKEAVPSELLVVGSGSIALGNMAAAREEAIARAMSKAVEDYLTARLGEIRIINSFGRLVREILPDAKDAIENFHILAKNLSKNHYRVLVKVKINREVIEERLRRNGITMEAAPDIRFLFMVSEEKDGRLLYWWKAPETFSQVSQTDLILYRVFQEHGFMPVDRGFGVSGIAYSEAMTSPSPGLSDLLQWGKSLSADVVISGRTVFLDDSRLFMTLKAVSVKEGVLLGEVKETGLAGLEKDGSVSADRQLERVARILFKRLSPSIVQGMSEEPLEVRLFNVQLKGLRSFKEFRKLQDFLRKEVLGVLSVMQSRIEGGSVTLTVAFQGEKEDLLGRVLKGKDIPVRLMLEKSRDNEIVLSTLE